MKIAIVVTKIGRGGAQRVSVVLAGYLKRRGHQVSILYYDGNGTYPLEEGIRCHQLPYSKNVILKHGKRIRAFMRYCKENQIELVLALFRGYDYTWLYRTCSSSRLILSQRNDPKAEYDHHVVARWESRFFFQRSRRSGFSDRGGERLFWESNPKEKFGHPQSGYEWDSKAL